MPLAFFRSADFKAIAFQETGEVDVVKGAIRSDLGLHKMSVSPLHRLRYSDLIPTKIGLLGDLEAKRQRSC